MIPDEVSAVPLGSVPMIECVLCFRGACGEVRLAFAKGSCEKFACKIIAKKKFSLGGKNQLVSIFPPLFLLYGVNYFVVSFKK